MLSLSLFSSSQRISVALYEYEKLKEFLIERINDNKIDRILLLIKKILDNNKGEIKRIFFSKGPGSFTAIRSIKAIAQGISLISNAKIITSTDFEIYLGDLAEKSDNVVVFFQDISGRLLYQYFKFNMNRYKSASKFLIGDTTQLNEFILTLKKNQKKLVVTTNQKKNLKLLKNFNEENFFVCNVSAKKLANAIFSGYGKLDQEIIYYHTYYEKI